MTKKKAKAEATETIVEEVKTPETDELAKEEIVETETSADVEVKLSDAKDELVMEASIEPKPAPKQKAPEYVPSTYVVLTNTSQNRLSLVDGNISITIEPREIKRDVRREDLRQLLRNKVIQNWFDKGILSSNLDATDQSVHEAVAPSNLTNAVERHDNGMNISASVKKFEPAGTVDINLL